MKKDWVILAHTVCPEVMPGFPACADYTDPDIGTVFSTSLLNGADITEKDDSLTIVRIVGEIEHFVMVDAGGALGTPPPTVGVVQIDEMIYKSTPGDGSGEMDPRQSSVMENDSILWRRRLEMHWSKSQATVGPFFIALGNSDFSSTPMAPHLDIRVARKLRQGDELLYSCAAVRFIQAGGTPEEFVWHASFNLRGFVKF